MERLLTKTRAILALALVMFVAALNRQEPVVYAVAVMLAAVGALGYLLPWVALRNVTLRAPEQPREMEAAEAEPVALGMVLRHAGWWPAWMVEVQADWEWAGRRFVTRDIVPFLPPGGHRRVLESAAFACRGQYRLQRVRLRSGFPLGLVHAEHEATLVPVQVTVHPARTPLQSLPRWSVSEDPTGDASIGRSGDSLELSMLRAYEPGDAVRRVDWHASARAGGLVVRHFLHSASVMVKVMIEPPSAREVGRAMAPSEQAVRVAAAVCAAVAGQAVRFRLLMPDAPPAADLDAAVRALASALPMDRAWDDDLVAKARQLRKGEQLLAVLAPDGVPDAVVRAAHAAAPAGARVLAMVATWPDMPDALLAQARALEQRLWAEGVEAQLAWT